MVKHRINSRQTAGGGGRCSATVALLLTTTMLLLPVMSCKPRPSGLRQAPVQVDPQQAMRYVEALLQFEPRHSGSAGAAAAAAWLAATSEQLGYATRIDQWTEQTSDGKVSFANVHATLPGPEPGVIILASHYDTKYLPDEPYFAGANDSGSSTGLLLEIMRQLQSIQPWQGCTLEFVFFDGEECVGDHYAHDNGLHGSKRMAAAIVADNSLDQYRAMLLMDMVGDRDLRITFPSDCDPALVRLALQAAQQLQRRQYFGYFHGIILDDHTPFQQIGMPTLNFIDFDYGPNNSYWHTHEDSLDKLSTESLAIVGDVFLTVLWNLAHDPAPEAKSAVPKP